MKLKILLKPLSDGDWHSFDDLSTQTHLDKKTILEVTNFLREYGIAEISEGGEAAKLDNQYLEL
jgi:hypothetical protein